MTNKKAIVLLSGGLDSATCLAIALERQFEVIALSFDYGQRHSSELEAAKQLAKHYNIAHHIFPVAIDQFKGSSLTDKTTAVPEHVHTNTVPNTYVPARNTIFLSIALGLAEVNQAQAIFIGANAVDYSGYPDCRPDYIQAFETMARLATQANLELSERGEAFSIEAPLMHLTKAEIIQKGSALGVDYGLTVSCYQADEQGRACGVCDSCHFRREGFAQAGVEDPTRYCV